MKVARLFDSEHWSQHADKSFVIVNNFNKLIFRQFTGYCQMALITLSASESPFKMCGMFNFNDRAAQWQKTYVIT